MYLMVRANPNAIMTETCLKPGSRP